MSEAAVLSLRDLHRTYRSGDRLLHVLDGVELDLSAGEIVGLVGPSGSGKSSLLHAAGLLEKPTSGRGIVEGRDCTDLS
ncbi:MAG: ATP-binding cassette domain-containing protein, partial [Phenylobacterium sp.]|nr:ATP-binding cassette domain-containing protein [Phenylobacterium sp.]